MAKELQKQSQGSLAEQIEATEQRLLHRQQMLGIRRTLLTEGFRQQMTSPMALLIAGGIGFVVGDLTRRKGEDSVTGNGNVPATSPLTEVVDNVVGWVRPIFVAEMAKVMQSFSTAASNHLSDQIYQFGSKFTNPPDQET